MEPDSKLGSYVVVSAIGEGGMGKVYKAHERGIVHRDLKPANI